MGYTAIENNNILIDLTQAALTTGWTVDGTAATHESCNPGRLYLRNYTLIIGETYRYTYQKNVSSGIITTNFGASQTGIGLVDETITATDTQLYFYADGNCTISDFNIELDEPDLGDYAQNTVLFSEGLNKWISFETIAPDSAFSMFTKTFLFRDGNAYVQEAGTANRNNFFGIQYNSTIYFSTNDQPTQVKTYQSVNYQANQLLITPPSGINTSHGEVSELIAQDFLQMTLGDGSSPSIFVYDSEGLYKASFMRSYPDLINGNILIGNYMQMGLQTTSASTILSLFTTEINYNHSAQGIR